MLRLLAIALLFTSLPAFGEAFVIRDYNVDLRLEPDSTIEVTERITADFAVPRHGLFRKIPVSYQINPAPGSGAIRPWGVGKIYSTLLTDIGVIGEKFKQRRDGEFQVIQIGSSDKFVTGQHTYTIRYRVLGAINFFSDHSELYWNLIGNQWDTSIEKASFQIHFPKEVTLGKSDYALYTGFAGARESRALFTLVVGNQLAGETTAALGPRQGMTVAVKLPQGYLSPVSGVKLVWLLWTNLYGNYRWPILSPFIVLLICFALWYLFGKDDPIIKQVYYQPPKDITSAEAGFLMCDKPSDRELVSLIIQWASQGYLQMHELEDGDYELKKLKPLPSTARSFEFMLFGGLFEKGQEARLSALKDTIGIPMREAREGLEQHMENQDFYERGTLLLGEGMRKWVAVGVGTFVSIGVVVCQLDRQNLVAWLLSYAAISGIIFFFGVIMPKKSKRGIEEYRILQGFKLFIDRADQGRLKLLMKENPLYFEETLAFAVAFGMSGPWVKKFEGIIAEPPTWYVSSRPGGVRFDHFRSSFDRGVGRMQGVFVAAAAQAQAAAGGSAFSGVGGLGGGGFSGGGFGGGGGGSW